MFTKDQYLSKKGKLVDWIEEEVKTAVQAEKYLSQPDAEL